MKTKQASKKAASKTSGKPHGKGSAASKRNGWQGGKWLRKTTRRRLYMRDDFSCVYCGASALDTDITLTIDHVLPRELGGTNVHSNLVTCCKTCNSSKQDTPVSRFIGRLEEDKGIDAKAVARRIRNSTKRQLPKLPVGWDK